MTRTATKARPRTKPPQERRDELIHAAYRLFLEQGVAPTTIEQITSRVRWRESILALKDLTVDTTVEFGGNKVLSGMVKRIEPALAMITLDSPTDLETFGKSL